MENIKKHYSGQYHRSTWTKATLLKDSQKIKFFEKEVLYVSRIPAHIVSTDVRVYSVEKKNNWMGQFSECWFPLTVVLVVQYQGIIQYQFW